MSTLTAELRATEHRLLTVAEYHRMAEAEIIKPEERTELIEGEIIRMAPMKSQHGQTCAWLTTQFVLLLNSLAEVRCQLPVLVNNHSEPEPDVALCLKKSYMAIHPQPKDVLLLVEIADSSYRYDRFVKVPLYAAHGIREVWIVDVNEKFIEIFRNPEANEYRSISRHDWQSKLAPLEFPEASINFAELK